MSKTIVMAHGANCGGWCFDTFREVFEARGFACHAPDLIGHGAEKETGQGILASVGMADYRAQMAAFVNALPETPILLGHSMGAIIAQQLAADGLAEKLVLLSPAPRAGIVPPTDAERKLCQDLMTIGPFWTRALDPNFDLACFYTLNLLPKAEQVKVFDRFGPESGRALFETFFWMFDSTGATAVDTAAVRCPVLCVSGAQDYIVSLETAKATADPYAQAEFWTLQDQAHMLLIEPGAEEIASRIADWLS
ncbi:MAG TPA: alpha/beta hydrolase [Methyloceanibacter sp.]|nr:alpha/beta hydrolase [Methyloceanibacter sp.]